jgi:hypothetical protein
MTSSGHGYVAPKGSGDAMRVRASLAVVGSIECGIAP